MERSSGKPNQDLQLILKTILFSVCLLSVIGAHATTFQYLYDDRNQLSKVVDSTGIVIEYIYDPVGLPAPDGTSRLIIYDAIPAHSGPQGGFRWAVGGGQEYFGVVPDLAVFGKGMANGLPLAAVVGRRELMSEFEGAMAETEYLDLTAPQLR